jgi:hypothetical protein
MFTERVTVSDFESGHFQAQLVERLGWAVGDAAAVEQQLSPEPVDEHEHRWEQFDHEPERAEAERSEEAAPRRVAVLSGTLH